MPARYQRAPKDSRTLDGTVFDSMHEMRTAQNLRALADSGAITDYKEQVPFVLVPKDALGSPIRYRADFVFMRDGKQVVMDAKGHKTQLYTLKKRLMFMLHGITIEEV